MKSTYNRLFSDYKKEVIKTYQELKDNGKLPTELEDPKPAKLRDYSLYRLRRKYYKEDDSLLRAFFDSENNYNGDHEKSIDWFKTDKFRPLINFIKGEANDTNANNIKLLAWLIDCKPYEVWKGETDTSVRREGVPNDQEEKENNKKRIQLETIPAELPVTSGQKESDKTGENNDCGNGAGDRPTPLEEKVITPAPRKPSWLAQTLKKPAFYIIIAVLWGGGYLLAEALTPRCMYWDTDRYVLISCRNAGTIGIDTLVIPRDPDKEKLRRIMQPDTLTKSALGRTWYAKVTVDSIEFFTKSGFHPIETEKKLRPVTVYILNKYIVENQAATTGK